MADKGIVVNDAGSGESVACLDARNTDNDGNPRILQLASNTVSPAVPENVEDGTPIRTVGFWNSENDPAEITSGVLPADLTSNLLDVSDASVFVVHGYVEAPSSGGTEFVEVRVTPLIFNSAGTKVCGLLPPIELKPVASAELTTDSTVTDELKFLHVIDTGPTTCMLFMAVASPSFGVEKVGFHVTASVEGLESGTLKLFAYKLTGENATQALSTRVFRDSYATAPGGFPPGELEPS